MDTDERPQIRALVSFPVEEHPDWFTDAACVSLELAAELKARGWMVLVDPADERALAMWEILNRHTQTPLRPKRKYFEANW